MSIIRGLIGLAVIFFIAFLFCKEKKSIKYKNIILMVVVQVVLTFLLLNTSVGLTILTAISNFFTWLTAQGMAGCNFVFGGIEVSKGSSVFFFNVLMPLVFISALIGILKWLGILDFIVKWIGWIFNKVTGLGEVESYVPIATTLLGSPQIFMTIQSQIRKMNFNQLFTVCLTVISGMSASMLASYMTMIDGKYVVIAVVLNLFSGLIISAIMNPYDEKIATADEEEKYIIAQANEPLDENNHFVHDKVTCRDGEENVQVAPVNVDLMDVSPRQLVSVATALIPFLQNDDVTRALMGSNMQRQAVPLLTTDSAVVGTGMEMKAAKDSGDVVVAEQDGVVEAVDAAKIVVKNSDDRRQVYELLKFKRSNQSNCVNQRPIVNKGDSIKKGQIIADGPSTKNGELALGKNPLIGFMTWEGYNYEDAVLLSERLVMDDVYTSIHIEEYESEARNTKLGDEEITRDIPNVGDDALKDLDETGIIRIGAEVSPNDILVGKVTPKGETELTAEERLLRAIFGEKAREVRDTSLRVPHGAGGIVVDVKVFTRENGDELAPGVNQNVRVYIAQKRKISVGDKMAGRHGNKGVVSRVLPVEDMPYLPNGRPLDIVLNPLGVPSRMNIGQVLEIHLGLASNALGWKVSTPVFEGANEEDIMQSLDMANDYANKSWEEFKDKWAETLKPEVLEYLGNHLDHRDEWRGVPIDHTGRVKLRDGRTGEEFDNPTTIGFMHYLKLHHLVDDKIHARSTGPYSLVTQQPLGGKAQFGGQRFGEMEVWALEAYGASYTLQEILTVKSDDIVGRVKTYEAIVKDENIPEPGVPESFKVLLKELQALGLDIKILREDNTEVEIQESIDDVDDFNINVNIEGVESDVEEENKNDGKVSLENVLGDIDLDDIDVDEEDSDDDFVISDEDVLEEADMLKEFEDLNKFLDADDSDK